ncbi:CPBP family intramembrane glutamic endopeptidase [Natronorubrum sp. FCH18a]|uniref:CPBP family intramembrane glutamic endopeptidase n=1 Tax=Natronorubrum sp. FCH18a TaxID=3447018 RepID=UPI003F511922
MAATTGNRPRLQDPAVRATSAFFILTLLLSLGIGLLIAASTRGTLQLAVPETLATIILLTPTIAAIVLTVATNGWRGLHDLLSPLLTWRVPVRWYLAALLFPAILNLSSIAVYSQLGRSLPAIPGEVPADFEPLLTGSIATTVLFISLFFFLASLFEEIGWRGYALPRLQSRTTALSSSLIIGVIWAVWHVPTFFLLPEAAQSAIPFLWYVPSVLAISIVFTWLYNNTNGSLLLATILHASLQVTNLVIPNLHSGPGGTQLYRLNVIILFVLVAIIVSTNGSQHLSRNHRRVTR